MSEQDDKVLRGIGSMVAQIPEVGELVDYRRSLPADLDREEMRRLVLQRARELGLALGGERLFTGHETPSPLLDTPLWQVVALAAQGLQEKYGELTVRDAVLWGSEKAGIDDFIVDYVEQSVTTGEPGAFMESIKGGVAPVMLPVNDGEPMVVCVATPYSDMGELIQKFRDESYRAFRDYPTHEAETYEDAARILKYKNQGMTRSQIAWQLLADRFPEIAALSEGQRKKQYAEEHSREMARIRQLIRRF